VRIVSLLPATTEIVHALGAGHHLVGRSHECDLPRGHPGTDRLAALPVVSRPRAPLEGDSAAIDRDVRALVRDGGGVFEIDPEVLRELAPDVVLTQSACEVCAVDASVVHAAITEQVGDHVTVVDLQPSRLADVLEDHRRVAAALDLHAAGDRVVAGLEARLDAVARAVAGRPRPTVGTVEWFDPLIAAGTWLPDLVQHAGGEPALSAAGGHAPVVAFADLVAADPDVLLLAPCGFTVRRGRQELPVLSEQPGFATLRAVRDRRAWLLDGHELVNRPGPRLIDTVELLAALLHPDTIARRALDHLAEPVHGPQPHAATSPSG
jgi:iron complex transport system substrate-binding protein